LLTVSGVFFAGRQHFSWMDYGMKNSKLRKQIEDLQSEKRRLLLAREISLSPMEIKKAAKKVGIADIDSEQSVVAQVTSVTKDKAVPPMTAEAPASSKPLVVKTVAVTPVSPAAVASYKKTDKPVKPAVKATAAE
jgi:hypothetical protein